METRVLIKLIKRPETGRQLLRRHRIQIGPFKSGAKLFLQMNHASGYNLQMTKKAFSQDRNECYAMCTTKARHDQIFIENGTYGGYLHIHTWRKFLTKP